MGINRWQPNIARIKMNKEIPDPNPNTGARNINSKGTKQPTIIQGKRFFILTNF
jgi:hypothetical protein